MVACRVLWFLGGPERAPCITLASRSGVRGWASAHSTPRRRTATTAGSGVRNEGHESVWERGWKTKTPAEAGGPGRASSFQSNNYARTGLPVHRQQHVAGALFMASWLPSGLGTGNNNFVTLLTNTPHPRDSEAVHRRRSDTRRPVRQHSHARRSRACPWRLHTPETRQQPSAPRTRSTA